MTDQLKQAAQQAQLVLQEHIRNNYESVAQELIDVEFALRTAIEQAEKQEPVAWMSPGKERLEFSRKDTVYGSHTIPLYTTPQPQREWVGLTDEAIYGAFRAVGLEAYHHRDAVVQTGYDRRINDFARAIEAKLKEKNHGLR